MKQSKDLHSDRLNEDLIEINERIARQKQLADQLCSTIPEFGQRFTIWTKVIGEFWHYDQATYSNPVTWNNDNRWITKIKSLSVGWSFFLEGVNPNIHKDAKPYVFPLEYLTIYNIHPQSIDELRNQYTPAQLAEIRLKKAAESVGMVASKKPVSGKEKWLQKIREDGTVRVSDIPRLYLNALVRSGDIVIENDQVKINSEK